MCYGVFDSFTVDFTTTGPPHNPAAQLCVPPSLVYFVSIQRGR